MDKRKQLIQSRLIELANEVDHNKPGVDFVLDQWDSLNIVDFTLKCEDEFNIKIPDEDMVNLMPLTIREFADYIYARGGKISQEHIAGAEKLKDKNAYKMLESKNTTVKKDNKVVKKIVQPIAFLSRVFNNNQNTGR